MFVDETSSHHSGRLAIAVCQKMMLMIWYGATKTNDDPTNRGSYYSKNHTCLCVFRLWWTHSLVLILGAYGHCNLILRMCSWISCTQYCTVYSSDVRARLRDPGLGFVKPQLRSGWTCSFKDDIDYKYICSCTVLSRHQLNEYQTVRVILLLRNHPLSSAGSTSNTSDSSPSRDDGPGSRNRR